MIVDQDIIKNYLLSYSIKYDTTKLFSTEEKEDFLNSCEVDISSYFMKFIQNCFLPGKTSHRLSLKFISWNDLYDCYLSFVSGYLNIKA
jgi:hypothetical protein